MSIPCSFTARSRPQPAGRSVSARLLKLMLLMAASCFVGPALLTGPACAQVIDFSRIDSFESLGTGTQNGASPPKIIVDDGNLHIVVFTILEVNAEARVYWRAFDGEPIDRTTVISAAGVQVFQTAGELKLEVIGDETRILKYAYMLFRLKRP